MDVSNIPKERRGSYVDVVPNDRYPDVVHTPTNGLKVRVMEQRGTQVVPTNLIYSMTFEARGQVRATPVSVRAHHPAPPREIIGFINSCLNPRANDPFVRALTRTFTDKVGSAGLSTVRTTAEQVRALIALAVEGIQNLRTVEGLLTTSNVTDGTPNDFDPTETASTRSPDAATTVLAAKARALVVDVTQSNFTAPDRELLRLIRGNSPIPAAVQAHITPWLESLTALFRGSPPPQRGIFVPRSDVHIMESTDHEEFSPVFPVSDAKGFEHYGSFQYGRGLSIEPGGNYERISARDPLQFLTDAQREAYLRGIVSDSLEERGRAVAAAAAALASNSDPSGGDAAILHLGENDQRNGDRTTMIANGLRNYIMSDRDAVTKLPVNNAAYLLTDLTPMGQQDTCACKGAEADLLLAAYMAGTQGMTQIVSSEEEAGQWVSAQMEQAAVGWADTQSKLRGMALEQGRRSLLDSVEGWNTITDEFRQNNAGLADRTQAAGNRADALGQDTRTLFNNPIPPRGQ